MKIISLSALALALASFGARAQDTSTSATTSPAAPSTTDQSAALPSDQPKAAEPNSMPADNSAKSAVLPSDDSSRSAALPSTDSTALPSGDAAKSDDTMKDNDSDLHKKTYRHGQARTPPSGMHRTRTAPSDLPLPSDSDVKAPASSGDISGPTTPSTSGTDQAVPPAPSTTDDSSAAHGSMTPPSDTTTSPGNTMPATPGDSTTAPAPKSDNSNK